MEIAASILASTLGGLIGGFFVIFGEVIRNRIVGARFELDLTEGSRIKTPYRDGYEGIFIRVRVQNTGMIMAKSCRAFLTRIEKENELGRFEPTNYAETYQLLWSGHEKPIALDLPNGLKRYVTVLRSSNNPLVKPIFQITATIPLLMYLNIVETPGKYRLQIMVSGDGIKAEFLTIIVTHTGKWDEVTVDNEPGISATAWTG